MDCVPSATPRRTFQRSWRGRSRSIASRSSRRGRPGRRSPAACSNARWSPGSLEVEAYADADRHRPASALVVDVFEAVAAQRIDLRQAAVEAEADLRVDVE